MTSRPALVLLVALLASSGCTGSQDVVDPAAAVETATVFVEAWTAKDYDAMAAELEPGSAWDATRLRRLFARATRAGEISSWSVALSGEVEQPSDEALQDVQSQRAVARAPYAITYASGAARREVGFEGDLALSYDRSAARWRVGFEPGLLWPEHPAARGFDVEETWPRRAAILDRKGRRLAVGRDEDRRYPVGSLAGATIGHLEPVRDLDRLQGASGLELALDERLAGAPTRKLVLVGGSRHCRLRSRADKKSGKAPPCERERVALLGRVEGRRGRDIRTTLDVDVQRAAQRAFAGTTGGSVVLAPSTGDLLAVVSSSPFDPGNYVGIGGIDPFNRAVSGLYPPGSSLKVMTGAAALQERVVTENTRLSGPPEYKGVRNFESGAFGSLDFATAVKFSVNTAFAQVAEDLGARRLTRYAQLFGFNSEPEMALAAGTSSFPFPQDEGDVMWGAIGQAQVLATPLQMATVAATIANGGKRMEPRILLKEREVGERVVSKKVAATMTRLMVDVVNGGTGTAADVRGVDVAGKTGTAEVDVGGKRMNHAWFISFAPSGAPEVALSVVSELGGVGGRVAAPLAGRILAAVLPLVR